ncbi:hypothetical protein HC761_01905 [bacterium]|nr:hypothetical protein [bacterium]
MRSYLRNPQRPIVFQPVVYRLRKSDRKAKAIWASSQGGRRRKNRSGGLLKSFRVLKENFGAVTVNFGEPIEMNDMLAQLEPDWRAKGFDEDKRPEWYPRLIDQLTDQILININRAADVNPIAMLAMVLLGTPKHVDG